MANSGIPLKQVPFPAAIYRVGYSQQASGYRGAWKSVLANLSLTNPAKTIATMRSVTPITGRIRRDFWGDDPR